MFDERKVLLWLLLLSRIEDCYPDVNIDRIIKWKTDSECIFYSAFIFKDGRKIMEILPIKYWEACTGEVEQQENVSNKRDDETFVLRHYLSGYFNEGALL